MTATLAKGNPLWDFAVWAYGQQGVEKACLALQDRLGADVNMLLFCCWLAYRNTPTTHLGKILGAALKVSREWQGNLIIPLRTSRQNLKNTVETLVGNERVAATALRERLKECELEMEQLQVLSLCGVVTDVGGETARAPLEQKDDALGNLKLYATAAGITLDPMAEMHVMRILTAVFGA